MKKVYLLAVIAALLFGALMYVYLSGSSASAVTVDKKTVVVAAVDIAPDTTITADMLKEEQVEATSVQVNALSTLSDAVGKCCPAQIVKGQQIQSNLLTDSTATGIHLSNQLAENMRAMTIKVEVDAGVGGYVQAGDHVDVLGAETDEDGNVLALLRMVENVEVIRVGQASEEGLNTYSYLTLTMTEDQCEALYAYQVSAPSGSAADYHVILRSAGGAQ